MRTDFYRNYLVIVLMAIMAFSYVDRMVFSVVLEAIKVDLALSDTQLGFLSGLGFALFFSVMGIPLARWADRGNRILIVTLTTALWSVAVSLCGVVGSFVQMFLVRIGVAVGEAGCQPPAHSLIPDYFSRAERPRAVARYMLGPPLGLMIGFFAGGWLNELYGWRWAFIILGVPGVVLAALSALTLREPRRNGEAQLRGANASDPPGAPAFREVAATLWANTTFRQLLFCFVVWYFCGWALLQWLPAFFIRSYRLETGELGMWLALIHGGCGLFATYLGGEWAARRASHNERRQLVGIAIMFTAFGACNVAALLAPNHYASFAMLAVGYIFNFAAQGPLFATIQTLVPPRMRATSVALINLLPSFIGTGLGPLAAGMLSDALHPWVGQDSLRYALLAFCPGYVWAAWHLWRSSRSVDRDIQAIRSAGAPVDTYICVDETRRAEI